MTFSCKNYLYDTDSCKKLKSECIPGRPGCVLEGKIALSEDLQKRIDELENQRKKKKS